MNILWWRVLVAGVLAENVYGIFLVLVLGDTSEALSPVGLIAAFSFLFLGGLWVGRASSAHPALHGALVGAVAVAFYFLLAAILLVSGVVDLDSSPEATAVIFSPLALLNHGIKILGSVLGAYLGGTRLKRGPVQAS
jgi:hypothetical protein